MNVRQLQIKLSTMNPETRVLFDTEAGQFDCHMVEIDRAFEEAAETSPDGQPYVSLHSDAPRHHGLLADAERFVDKFKEVLAAWRTIQEGDVHADDCKVERFPNGMFGYFIEKPCTCGRHERVDAARALLDKTAAAMEEPPRG